MVDTEEASTGNTIKLILFLIFAGLTFSQLLTYAHRFNPLSLLPRGRSGPTILYGVAGTDIAGTDVATNQAPTGIVPAILLIAINIALWVEHPSKVGRVPLILTFIFNLALVVLQVGIAAPELKIAAAVPQTNIQNIWTLSDLHTKWNTIYFVLAVISALITLGVLIYLLRRNDFVLSYVSRATGRFQAWKEPSPVRKIKLVLFLVFALLTFYQFLSYANPVRHDPSKLKDAINKITLSRNGNADVGLVVISPSNPASPVPLLIVVLNVILWVIYPRQIGRLLFTLSFLANLAIVLIQNIDKAVFQQSGGFQGMSIEARFLQLDQLDNLYRSLAIFSTLIVLGMLIQVWRKQQFRPYSQP